MLCETPAFSFGAHGSIFFFTDLSVLGNKAGSPHKVNYLFSPHFFLCVACQALPVSLGRLGPRTMPVIHERLSPFFTSERSLFAVLVRF